jgi:hypothetical protein
MEPALMDLRIENLRFLKGTIDPEAWKRTLQWQRLQYIHRYQQKYPRAFLSAGQKVADRVGPEGWIRFSLTINQEGQVTSCRSREPEDLLGLGDRVCSVLVNRRFPAPERGVAALRFEVGFFLKRPEPSPGVGSLCLQHFPLDPRRFAGTIWEHEACMGSEASGWIPKREECSRSCCWHFTGGIPTAP